MLTTWVKTLYRFPGKNLASHAGVFREARFSSLKSSWEARKNLACVLRLLVFRHSENRHLKWDHRSVFWFFIAVPVAGASVLWRLLIVNKREGRTEINTKLEILHLDFSVEIANNFAASLCTDIRGRLYTAFMCQSWVWSWVVKLDISVVVCQHLFNCQRKNKQK